MPPAPVPQDERDRLASARALRVLTRARETVDTVLCVLREQLGVERAFVNIVDETTQHPLFTDPAGPESSCRADSFCAHAVHARSPLIVPDAWRDPRFFDNGHVRSGFIGFYYGFPVYTPEGLPAGALCVHGPDPRTPRPEELALMERLASLIGESLRIARTAWDTERAQRDLEERIARLAEQAQAGPPVSAGASAVLTNLSHEIRTPMNAIVGYLDVLNAPDADAEIRADALTTIRRNADSLLAMLDDLLYLARPDAGPPTLAGPYSPDEVVTAAVRSAETEAADKGVAIAVRADPCPPVSGDAIALRRILDALIGNAVKFTDTGTVTVGCHVDPGGTLAVEISDTGIGMTADQALRAFEPFMQGDPSTTRRHAGAGIGLSVARVLARRLGGDIAIVRTVPGDGTTVRLSVPTRAAQAAADGPVRGLRVLVVEDGPDNRRLLRFYLEQAGAVVVEATHGGEALEHLNGTGGGFDLVLMDMQMPVMDGYEAARAIRARGLSIPVVALTAHASPDDRGRCLNAGCDDYASKPIDRTRLLSVCARWGRRSENTDAA